MLFDRYKLGSTITQSRMMAKKKSLPTQLKEALNYHLFHNDIAQDTELKKLMSDLNKLDRRVAEVKREIIRNRKTREEALKQAQEFSDGLIPPKSTQHDQTTETNVSTRTDKAS